MRILSFVRTTLHVKKKKKETHTTAKRQRRMAIQNVITTVNYKQRVKLCLAYAYSIDIIDLQYIHNNFCSFSIDALYKKKIIQFLAS